MKASDFEKDAPGDLVANLDGRLSFVPRPLPPAIAWDNRSVTLIAQAVQAVAQLDGSGAFGRVARPEQLVRLFLRREAELSSRIEQTHATVRDMLLFEGTSATPEASSEVREVHNNYQSLLEGLTIVRQGRPISLALLRHLHSKLFDGLDAMHVRTGELRSVPVFIGASKDIREARFVPPPPLQVEGCMRELERFVQRETTIPSIVRAALAHYQFEAIHPFNDGNGRIGRVLIMLILVGDGLLSLPLFNPSAGLERRRRLYYNHLSDVSRRGAWREWINFFCECVIEEAAESTRLLNRLERLRQTYHRRVRGDRARQRLGLLIEELFGEPVQTGASVRRLLDCSPTAAYQALEKLVDLRILGEVTGRERGRVFLANGIVKLFSSTRANRRGPRTNG